MMTRNDASAIIRHAWKLYRLYRRHPRFRSPIRQATAALVQIDLQSHFSVLTSGKSTLSLCNFLLAPVSSDSSGDESGGDDPCTSRDDGRASNGSGSCDATSSGEAGDVVGRANGDGDDNGPSERMTGMTGPPASPCSSSAQRMQHSHRSKGRYREAVQADF